MMNDDKKTSEKACINIKKERKKENNHTNISPSSSTMPLMCCRRPSMIQLLLSLTTFTCTTWIFFFDCFCCCCCSSTIPVDNTISIAFVSAYTTTTTNNNNNAATTTFSSTSSSTTTARASLFAREKTTDDVLKGSDDISSLHVPWLIVGGGIHGTHIAVRLLAKKDSIGNGNGNGNSNSNGNGNGGTSIGKECEKHLCIVDENKELLYKWKSRTAATGMNYLRSSAAFHIDVDEQSLRRQFGKRRTKNTASLSSSSSSSTSSSTSRKKKNRQRRRSRRKQNHNGNHKYKYQHQRQREGKIQNAFANDYERPRLDIFNEHCDSVIAKYDLSKLHVQGKVTSIQPFDDHVRVEVSVSNTGGDDDDNDDNDDDDDDNGNDDVDNKNIIVYTADQVVLALGNDEPLYAEWVEQEDIDSGLVQHLLDVDRNSDIIKTRMIQSDDDDDNDNDNKQSLVDSAEENKSNDSFSSVVAVIGGGISAAHKVLDLIKESKEKYPWTWRQRTAIHLISRHEMREKQFDTHQDWMMDRAAAKRSEEGGGSGLPKRQRMFFNTSSWKERRLIITKERIPGTVTKEVNRGDEGLMYAIDNGDVYWHQEDVVSKITLKDKSGSKVQSMQLLLSSGETINVDKILLATGFGKGIPGGTLIKRDLIEKSGLKVSDFCGYPIVDSDLKWHPRISVAGALAELEIGPSARNIAGARLAAERIIKP